MRYFSYQMLQKCITRGFTGTTTSKFFAQIPQLQPSLLCLEWEMRQFQTAPGDTNTRYDTRTRARKLSLNTHFCRKIEFEIISSIVAIDTATRMFQYEILINILCRNKLLFNFKKVSFPLCTFCKLKEKITLHPFHECIEAQTLTVIAFIQQLFFSLLVSTPQGAV